MERNEKRQERKKREKERKKERGDTFEIAPLLSLIAPYMPRIPIKISIAGLTQ